eukprot:12472860-Ditylum_brightwellii.AAC.1
MTKLYIATAYRVQQTHKEGTSAAYTQQMKILCQKGYSNPNPRKQWLKDFTKVIKNGRRTEKYCSWKISTQH